MLHEADTLVVQLSGQPIVAVDIDLRGKGEPGLNANVTQAELRIEEVEVQHALRPPGESEPGPALAIEKLDGATILHAAEDADQPLEDRPSRRIWSTSLSLRWEP